jgi:ketosteroid isomerase-like protein
LPDRAKQSILAIQQQWLEYELAGDTMRVVSLCLDNVIWLPPNEPALRGKNVVAAWLAAAPKRRIQRIEITNVQIHRSGELAYKVADFATWFEEADEPVTGSHLWVLRESLPDQWHVAVVAWSTAGTESSSLRRGSPARPHATWSIALFYLVMQAHRKDTILCCGRASTPAVAIPATFFSSLLKRLLTHELGYKGQTRQEPPTTI